MLFFAVLALLICHREVSSFRYAPHSQKHQFAPSLTGGGVPIVGGTLSSASTINVKSCLQFALLSTVGDDPPSASSRTTSASTTSASTTSASTTSSASASPINVRRTLEILLSSRSSLAEKKAAYQSVRELRQSPESDKLEKVLDEMLSLIEEAKTNPFCRVRLPFPLPSFRVKVGSLRRLLQSTTTIMGSTKDDEENKKEKRRGLLIILNQLVNSEKENSSIRKLEKESIQQSKGTDMAEMIRRTPKNLETPTYKVLEAKPRWEVRRYDSFSVCSVQMTKKDDSNSNANGKNGTTAFGSLAGYIFGKNTANKAMAMTTPVMMSDNGNKMSFVMGSNFWTDASLASAPRPMDDSGVQLEVKQGSAVAVLWFGGYADKKATESRKEELLASIANDGKNWKLAVPSDPPFLMQYNDPFQPPWSRRNEVAVAVTAVGSDAQF